MSAEYVRRAYGVDYKRGDRLTFDGKPGTLVSFPGPYLGIRLDGEKHTSRCHPTWRIEREVPAWAETAEMPVRRSSCGARVCSTDYTHGPHRHENGFTILEAKP